MIALIILFWLTCLKIAILPETQSNREKKRLWVRVVHSIRIWLCIFCFCAIIWLCDSCLVCCLVEHMSINLRVTNSVVLYHAATIAVVKTES